jgi:hypothetical protein
VKEEEEEEKGKKPKEWKKNNAIANAHIWNKKKIRSKWNNKKKREREKMFDYKKIKRNFF